MAEFSGGRVGGAKVYMKIKGGPDFSRALTEGLFNSAGQTQLIKENTEIAQVAQQRISNITRSNYRRPTVSSGRLQYAIEHPKNISVTAFRIGVGNESWLNRSEAKYWRTIEQGSKIAWTKRSFLSLDLRGTFGETLGPVRGWPSGKNYSAGPGFASGGGGSAAMGKFHPTGKFWTNPQTGVRSRMPVFRPGHEIEGKNAYRKAFEQGEFQRSSVDSARRQIQRTLGRGGGIVADTGFLPPGV